MTLAELIACGVKPTQARLFQEPLTAALALNAITNPFQVAAFVAQVGHESEDFTHLEESLYYRDAARAATIFRAFHNAKEAEPYMQRPEAMANRVYANRNGNGDEESGDGWRYRGRGLIMLTGRTNYALATTSAIRDYLAHPDLVAEPSDACLTSVGFWMRTGCDRVTSDFDAITRKINPAMQGAQDRRDRFKVCRAVFGA